MDTEIMEQSVIELVQQVVILLTQHTQSDDPQVIDALVTTGMNAASAHYLTAFVPLAFARALLDSQGPTFQPTYQIYNPISGKQASFPLIEQPIYQAAYQMAKLWLTQGIDRERFFAVAGRSAELKAINDVLRQGGQLKTIQAAEPVLCDVDFV